MFLHKIGKLFAIGCVGLVILVALIVAIAVATSSGNSSTATTSATTSQVTQPAQQSTQAAVTATPVHTLKWTTVETFSGNGNKKTAIFTAPSDWKILYTCTYQNIGGVTGDGALGVNVYGSDGSIIDPGAINATCKDGVAKTTGETEEHQSGQVYLDVVGTGDWTIQVQELR